MLNNARDLTLLTDPVPTVLKRPPPLLLRASRHTALPEPSHRCFCCSCSCSSHQGWTCAAAAAAAATAVSLCVNLALLCQRARQVAAV